MARDKGAAPSRRLPSRSGRASFEADPTEQEDAAEFPDDRAGGTPARQQGQSSSSSAVAPGTALHGSEAYHSSRAASNGEGTAGLSEQEKKPSNSSSDIPEGAAATNSSNSVVAEATTFAPVPVAAPRGRGRPRKKPLEVKMDGIKTPPVSPRAGERSQAAVAAATTGVVAATGAVSEPLQSAVQQKGGSDDGGKKVGWGTTEEQDGSGGAVGNESDEWSEDDEVHHLPKHVKAQFGHVR